DRFQERRISLLAPLVRGRKGHYRELFEDLRKKGYLRVRVEGEVQELVPKMQVDRHKIHDIELVVDRLQVTDDLKARLSQSVQQTLKLGKDLLFVLQEPDKESNGRQSNSRKSAKANQSELFTGQAGESVQYSKLLMCEDTGISYE